MPRFHRRDWLRHTGLGGAALAFTGATASGWLPSVARAAANAPGRRRHCILLWMSGGPAQTDTFDMKPGHANGGELQEAPTSVPGLRFSQHLPGLARHADKLAIVRSLKTKEGDHARGTQLMRTGYPPMGVVRYPAIGAGLAKELALPDDALPPYVSIGPALSLNREAYGSGFLGPRYAPLVVGAPQGLSPEAAPAKGFAPLRVDSVSPPPGVTDGQMAERVELWRSLETGFVGSHDGGATRAHQATYDSALRMIHSDAAAAFRLDQEPDTVRERYGRGLFGQGCLLARRLVERGVPFVEVTLGGWDTHADGFNQVRNLSLQLDAGWATLMTDLEERGLLESTTILWMGEFGRTPQVNASAGRDHFPRAWSCVLAGGGIAGGQAYGRTDAGGGDVEENPVSATQVLATLCEAVGVPPDSENTSESGRPIKLVDDSPIEALLA